MIDILYCENCKKNPSQHQNGLCDPCYQADMEKRIAEIMAQMPEKPVVSKKTSKRSK